MMVVIENILHRHSVRPTVKKRYPNESVKGGLKINYYMIED
jgi:hypothetical protein